MSLLTHFSFLLASHCYLWSLILKTATELLPAIFGTNAPGNIKSNIIPLCSVLSKNVLLPGNQCPREKYKNMEKNCLCNFESHESFLSFYNSHSKHLHSVYNGPDIIPYVNSFSSHMADTFILPSLQMRPVCTRPWDPEGGGSWFPGRNERRFLCIDSLGAHGSLDIKEKKTFNSRKELLKVKIGPLYFLYVSYLVMFRKVILT